MIYSNHLCQQYTVYFISICNFIKIAYKQKICIFGKMHINVLYLLYCTYYNINMYWQVLGWIYI